MADWENPLNKILGDPPPALRAFATTAVGDKSDITEDFFNKDELNILRDSADRAFQKRDNFSTNKDLPPNETYMGYGDYEVGGEKAFRTYDGTEAMYHALTDRPSSLSFTLGMAHVKKEEDGSYTISDKYDFAAKKEQVDKIKGEGTFAIMNKFMEGVVANGLLGVGNVWGNLVAPENYGRDVKIKIPAREKK